MVLQGGATDGTAVDDFRSLYPLPTYDIVNNPNLLKTMAIKRFICLVCHFCFLISFSGQSLTTSKQVVLQGYWWDYFNANYSYKYADYLSALAPRLRSIGIDAFGFLHGKKSSNYLYGIFSV